MDLSAELSAPYLSGDNSSCQVSGIYPYPIRGIQTGYRSLKPIKTDLGRKYLVHSILWVVASEHLLFCSETCRYTVAECIERKTRNLITD